MKLLSRVLSLYCTATRYFPPAMLSLFLLFVRIVWGYAFFVTGQGKLEHIDRVTKYFASIPIPAPHANAIFIGSLECFGGLLLLVGLFSRPIALLMVGNLTVAYLTTEMPALKSLFTDGNPQDVINAAPFWFLVTSLLVLALGPGILSLDAVIKWSLRKFNPPTPAIPAPPP